MAFATLPAAFFRRRGWRLAALPEWWHLLSLDAPSVAVVWSWSIARALNIHLPLSSPLLLALGTWMVYVADRILDGVFIYSHGSLRDRHFFYMRHRSAFLIALVPACLLLLWLIATHMNPAARSEDVAVLSAALLYFGIVHIYGQAAERWLPKELVVGVLFALATVVPVWSRLGADPDHKITGQRLALVPIVTLFAALCWMNCVAIEKWEREHEALPGVLLPNRTTLWAQSRFRWLTLGIAIAALSFAVIGELGLGTPRVPAIFLAGMLTAAGFAALDRPENSLHSSVFHLRVAADAVMLTPLLFAVFLR